MIFKKTLKKITKKIESMSKWFLNRSIKFKILFIILITAITIVAILFIRPLFIYHTYNLGSSAALLPDDNQSTADKITYDTKAKTFTYDNGQSTSNSESAQTGASNVTAIAYEDIADGGISVTDSSNSISFSLTPKFSVLDGKKSSNHIVYPLSSGDGWLVYTMQSTGVKEDIVLTKNSGDTMTVSYNLGLGDGLEAKLESNGSIGIYGNSVLSGSVTTTTDEDAQTLVNARKNATKDTLMFSIPKPTIFDKNKNESSATASYTISDSTLTVKIIGLDKATYPLSIDPSIYVVTAQQFMNGNNETNVNFDVDNKLIKKAATTGARFDSWNSTINLTAPTWGQGVVAAGGKVYAIGGSSFYGQTYNTQGTDTFVVPSGVTSINVKMWGGGGGGGAGGSAASGGSGGGSGYVYGTITVTPGETLTIYVGGGGKGGIVNTAGGGGGGGGYSSLYRGSTLLAVVAGGGGGGGGRATSTHTGGSGGGGGGTTGANGGTAGGTVNTNIGGKGGTQTAGGAAGTGGRNLGTAGGSLTGGLGANGNSSTSGADGSSANGGLATGGSGGSITVTTYAAGGGGGSGYYGGGGGNSSTGTTITTGGSGGGGGSSYTTSSMSSVTNTAGNGTTPGNNNDAYRNNAGNGGNSGTTNAAGSAGTNGLVMITYGSSTDTVVEKSVSWAQFNTTTGAIESSDPGSGTCSGWCTTASYNLPGARTNFSLVAYNGFLYAMGGIDETGTRQSTIYISKLGANGEPQLWSPTSTDQSTWTYWYTDTGLTSTRSSFGAAAYNNRMYIVGGLTGTGTGNPLSSVQIATINPNGTLGTWTDSVSLSTARHSHDVQIYNDRIYVLGGSEWWLGGTPTTSILYSKINSDGTLNAWTSTTPLPVGRSNSGGNFSTIWGGYIYLSGGCGALDYNGYCTSVLTGTVVASINADGSLDTWNEVGGVSLQRTGHSLITWQDHIYEIGGCSLQNSTTGTCNGSYSSILYGEINKDGDASTVGQTVASGTGTCSGATPSECNLPGTTNTGNMLSSTFITNGYLYVVGGCTNNTCSTTIGTTSYVAISSTGIMSKPTTCPSGSYQGTIWCVDNVHTVSGGIAAASPIVFNGIAYLVGGLNGTSNTNTIVRTTLNSDGSIGAWTSQTMTGVGATSVSYLYAYARSNPSAASTIPGNLFIFGGCATSSAAGCTAYAQGVYKCNILSTGAISGCTTSGQLQIGILPGDTATGLGIMSGTVYANYVYLIGGVSPNLVDLTSVRYAKIDNNNNIVAVSGSSWIESPQKMAIGRRRSAAFGYNGYLYAVGGYEATSGVLADIEFIKINVSDGSLGSSTEGWVTSAVQINQRWGLSVSVSNSFAYVIGGCTAGSSPSGCTSRTDVIQTFQIYNNDSGAPASYTTSANTYSTSPNRVGASSTILNGYIYVAGGCTSTTDCTTATNNVSYAAIDVNGNIGTWSSTTANLPNNLTGGKLETVGGSLYYVGGKTVGGSTCTATGESKFEKYDNISGTLISDLYNSTTFPNSPSSIQTLNNSTLSSSSGIGDNFGGRLSATLCAPQTGNYTFWISSDDSSELKISTNSSPNNTSVIASVNGWTNVNTWNTYSSQQSVTVALVAGQSYYIEANYKEGTGGDHVEVGWQLPNGTYERPIPSSRYMAPTTSATSTGAQSAVYYATPSSDGNIATWGTATNSLPNTRTNFASAVWNNRIYIVGGEGTDSGCTNGVCNTVYVSPQLNSGGNITSAWSTTSTSFPVARSGTTVVAYANNLYLFGGYDGTNYLSDSQFAKISTTDGSVGSWTYSTSLPTPISQADSFAANGYIYLIGGKSTAATCDSVTLVAPISANTSIASGNNPTGIGDWYETNQKYTGSRYGAAALYYDGKAYVIGGACGATLTYASPVIQQTTLLSQPQVAKYSIMIDTDTDVFPSSWLLNGVDNSIGAKWQLKYRSMTNANSSCATTAMTTWGRETNFGNVTLGVPGTYTPKDSGGTSTNCARYYYFSVTIDSSQAYGYPDDVSRGPTITDLTLNFTADPSKRLMHGRTFTGGLQQPIDTPLYTY